jgi:hypothetical protein
MYRNRLRFRKREKKSRGTVDLRVSGTEENGTGLEALWNIEPRYTSHFGVCGSSVIQMLTVVSLTANSRHAATGYCSPEQLTFRLSGS